MDTTILLISIEMSGTVHLVEMQPFRRAKGDWNVEIAATPDQARQLATALLEWADAKEPRRD